jgi:carboxyl-terminal processing protease
VTVKNVGRGRSQESQANLRNLAGDAVLLHEGRFDISNMQPGEVRKVAFTFEVLGGKQARADGEVRLELSVVDRDLREAVAEKLRLPLRPAVAFSGPSTTLRAKVSAELFASPHAGSRGFGRIPVGGTVTSDGAVGGFSRVSIGQGRVAFLRSADCEAAAGSTAALAFEDVVHAPPAVEVTAPVLTTTSDRIPLSGVISDDVKVLDMYAFVGGKKVHYRSNRHGADPRRLSFDATLPLRPGVNFITVVARESPDTATRRSFVIRRDGPAGELLATPKGDDEMSESSPSDD